MTININVKHIVGGLLLISILVSCNMWNAWFGREEINLGEFITLQVEEPIEDQTTRWVFAQLPDSSKIVGFLPSDTSNMVSFQPDLAGEYDVLLQITTNGETEEISYFYEIVVAEDSSLISREIPEHLLATENTEDTTVTDTPSVVSYNGSGDSRPYLSKVMTPGQTKSTVNRRSSGTRKKSVRSTKTQTSRGNLIPRATKTYTIQVSSWPSLDEAQIASQELLNKYGIDSYIQRAFFKDKDEIYYRLRVGNFQEQLDAENYAKEIQNMTSLPVWVDYVRQEM
ncbi:SPOR domain-containing protein [bacterium]|nr:SPOR domain-containing protein [bacterium]